MVSTLKDKYKNEVAPALAKEFGYKNPMSIPKLEKIVLNMGLGEAIQNARFSMPPSTTCRLFPVSARW